jgi:hypothetical protein
MNEDGMDEDGMIEATYSRWMNFQHGANFLMGFIEARDDEQEARIDFRTVSGWDGDNIATVASISNWDAAALEERGLVQWLKSLGWEQQAAEKGSEVWTFLLQLEPDPYK